MPQVVRPMPPPPACDKALSMRVRRRGLLKMAGGLPLLPAAITACAGRTTVQFLDDGERAALAHLADLVLPPDDEPGGAALGAVDYIDRFLSGEGLVFGSGPFSGRTPFPDERGLPSSTFPPDDWAVAEPLDRVQSAAIRKLLFDPDTGLRAVFRANLRGVTSSTALADLDGAFVDVLVQLVSEAAFGPPEYGGNVDLLGWKMIGYEGDRMPLGFSTFDEVAGVMRDDPNAPVSLPNPGPDPQPIDDDVAALLTTAIALLGGRDTKA
jgi:hypothetical protein